MKKRLLIFALVSGLVAIVLSGCAKPAVASKMKVVTSTSLVEAIAVEVGGDRVEVVNLVPPAQHPGNFDASPADIQKLAEASLFLQQGLPGETYIDRLIASANNPALKLVKFSVPGNWMLPSVQIIATDRVAEALAQIDVKNADAYLKAAADYKSRIAAKELDIKNRLGKAGITGVNVIASVRQADFLKWAGFNVVGTYGAPETITPQVQKELIDKGRETGVDVVVDNLQDGFDAGKGIASDLGVKNVNLSNFPGGYDGTASWAKAIDYNVDLILEAISK